MNKTNISMQWQFNEQQMAVMQRFGCQLP